MVPRSAAGLGPGDEAVTTPMTFAATANCVLYTGAEVRFADIDPGTLIIEPDLVAAAITPRTKAILPVDYAGHPADYDALRAIADGAPGGRLTIIADASHSLGATRDGKRVGTLADMTVLSLHPAKILTTGEGGAVLTDDDELAVRLRRFRNHGIATELAARTDWTYAMVELGYNYRLTDVGAALGSSQLTRLAEFLGRRRELAARYRSGWRATRTSTSRSSSPERTRPGTSASRSSASIGWGSIGAASTGRCGPRGSGSTSTTSRSTSTPTTVSGIPGSPSPSPTPPTSGC